MLNGILVFFKSRDWKRVFLEFSAFMFWFHLAIGISFIVFEPMRKGFLDWIVQHNQEYFIDYLNWLLENGYAGPTPEPEYRDSVESYIMHLMIFVKTIPLYMR